MARTEQSLEKAISEIPAIREEFWKNVRVLGDDLSLNQSLEKAGRVADFLEFGELMCRDALHRNESAGGHFREEYQTEDGEAKRNDAEFSYVAAWEYTGDLAKPKLHKEPLTFDYVHPAYGESLARPGMALPASARQVFGIDRRLRVAGGQNIVPPVAACAIRNGVGAALRGQAVIARQVRAGAAAFHAELSRQTNAFVATRAGGLG